MKKYGFPVLITITVAFVMFLTGFFIGRNFNRQNIQLQTVQKDTLTIPVSTAPAQTASAQSGPEEKININTATSEQLQTLPGIGEVLSQRIIDYRTKYGAFRSVNELTDVEGIGDKILESLRDYATVGG